MEEEKKWFRIAELERLSGVSRRTIHFYLREGLLHPPMKTGKTMAYYDSAHLEKIAYIRRARRKGVPLVAVREGIAAMDTHEPVSFSSEPASPRTDTKHPSGKRIFSKSRGTGTRENILVLGCRLFRQKGYRATRVSDITRELNIGKGTFYFHFSDKKELFLECVPRIFQELFDRGWDRIRREKNPQKRLETRGRAVLPVLQEFCTILQLGKEALEDPDPKLKRLGEQTYLSIRKPLENDIERGIQKGIFQNVDPKIAGAFLIGVMESLYALQTVDKQPPSIKSWNAVLELTLFGLKGAKGPQSMEKTIDKAARKRK